MSAKAKPADELGFGAAMEELEAILHRVESDEIDIDQLGVELKRAAELLEICRGKIRRAEVEVSQIVQTLEAPEAAPPSPAAPDEEASAPEPESESQSEGPRAGETATLFDQDG